ncbi:MAG: hypothetical protein C5B49_08690 [Bdellovibrio sp.]|nr:MAG: hypothetical protein C5B49_08690 [Bdellovibrio sp.]
MILQIWLRIFLIVAMVVTPLFVAHYFSEKTSIEMAFEMQQRASSSHLVDSHLALLKEIAKHNPAGTAEYRKEFERVVNDKLINQDLSLVRERLVHQMIMQTLRNAVLVLLASGSFSFLVARSIVGRVAQLVEENRRQSHRLERLTSLENWQRLARVLVHELRAPVTPIKLVATDIESKFLGLDSGAFGRYLTEGASLLRTQVGVIERMMESFLKFAKLPEVKRSPASVGEFCRRFVDQYRASYPGVELSCRLEKISQDVIPFDADLLNQLFFNLLKNAAEANAPSVCGSAEQAKSSPSAPSQTERLPIQAVLRARQESGRTWISFTNQGNAIPTELVDRIFDFYVTGKSGNANFGIGLTVAKKIALDHGGDLQLKENSKARGVTFELELPNG